MRYISLCLCAIGALLCVGTSCQGPVPTPTPVDETATMTVTSSAFQDGGAIPVRFTGYGQDVSPSIDWTNVPDGTKEFALIMHDSDASEPFGFGPFVHWVFYKIPASVGGILEDVPKEAAVGTTAWQGTNSFGTIGYAGPRPPSGTHHYHFAVYALDTALDVGAGLDRLGLLDAMSGHILAKGELVGTYSP